MKTREQITALIKSASKEAIENGAPKKEAYEMSVLSAQLDVLIDIRDILHENL